MPPPSSLSTKRQKREAAIAAVAAAVAKRSSVSVQAASAAAAGKGPGAAAEVLRARNKAAAAVVAAAATALTAAADAADAEMNSPEAQKALVSLHLVWSVHLVWSCLEGVLECVCVVLVHMRRKMQVCRSSRGIRGWVLVRVVNKSHGSSIRLAAASQPSTCPHQRGARVRILCCPSIDFQRHTVEPLGF